MSSERKKRGRKHGSFAIAIDGRMGSQREGRGEESERLFSTTYTIRHSTTHPVVLCGEARETLAEPLARLAALLRLHADLVPAARVEIVDAAHAVDGDLLGRGRGLLCLALGH